MRGVVLFWVLAVSAPCLADRAAAKQAYDRAVKQYNLGEYQAALDGFTAAYNEFPDARLLYNLAQCSRMLGQKTRAVTLFRSYLRESGGKYSNAADVQRIIAALEQDIAREQESKERPPQGVESLQLAPAAKSQNGSVAGIPYVPPTGNRTGGQERKGMPRLRVAGIGLTAGGVVLALIGIGLGASAPGIADNADHAGSLADARSQHERAVAFNTAGWSLAGVGGVVAVAGVVMIALPSRSGKLRAFVGPSGAGVKGVW